MTHSARILIVEDEPDIVFSLQEDLRRQGYDTAVCSDGDDAIARGTTEQWDLILLDVILPGPSGFEICAALRRASVRTPIIMLTARAHEGDKERGLDTGADDYVTKPFSPTRPHSRAAAASRDRRGAARSLRGLRTRYRPCGASACRCVGRSDGAGIPHPAGVRSQRWSRAEPRAVDRGGVGAGHCDY